MPYNPKEIISSYEKNAQLEDESEKGLSLRVELPREFIKQHLAATDVALDAGGGTGINAILMAQRCQKVTLLDLTPKMLELARENIAQARVEDKIELVQGDITDLSQFPDGAFSFVVCVGDALSYSLDQRFQALAELVRVAQTGATLIVGCDSKLGFMRLKLAQGLLDEAIEIYQGGECYCGMGPRTHLFTVNEMTELLKGNGCRALQVASTPTLTDTIDATPYRQQETWEKLKGLEKQLCTMPELWGVGLHLLFVARKE